MNTLTGGEEWHLLLALLRWLNAPQFVIACGKSGVAALPCCVGLTLPSLSLLVRRGASPPCPAVGSTHPSLSLNGTFAGT